MSEDLNLPTPAELAIAVDQAIDGERTAKYAAPAEGARAETRRAATGGAGMTARLDFPDPTLVAINAAARVPQDVAALHGDPDALYLGLQAVLEAERKCLASIGARAYLRALAKLIESGARP